MEYNKRQTTVENFNRNNWDNILYLPMKLSNTLSNTFVFVKARPAYLSRPYYRYIGKDAHLALSNDTIKELKLGRGFLIGRIEDSTDPDDFYPEEENVFANEIILTPTGKPPPLAVRLEKALPFRR